MKIKNHKRLLVRSGLALVLLTLLVFGAFDATSQPGKQTDYSALDLYTEVFSKVQMLYVRQVDPKELVYASINGMLQSLDSHSSFMTPEMMGEMRTQISGKYGGLGMQIGKGKNGYIEIEGVFDDTPASRAGLKVNDLITKIENKDTLDMNVNDAANLMRGDPATKVNIQIFREGWTAPKDFSLTREIINMKSIRIAEVLDGQIGHIWLRGFQDTSTNELLKVLQDMEQGQGLRGLILDLRDNPGGPLKQAIDVSDLFLDKGIIVSIKGREGQAGENKNYMATASGKAREYPIVVLVNEGSASASEIVAGALQDQGRAVVVGIKTFGKGSVQTILEMRDGSGLRLTTALYYTPSGRSIQAKGIEPDIVINQGEVVVAPGNDGERIREENLPGHFNNPNENQGAAPTTAPAQDRKTGDKKAEAVEPKKRDVQLERAAEILKSYIIFEGAKKKVAAPQ